MAWRRKFPLPIISLVKSFSFAGFLLHWELGGCASGAVRWLAISTLPNIHQQPSFSFTNLLFWWRWFHPWIALSMFHSNVSLLSTISTTIILWREKRKTKSRLLSADLHLHSPCKTISSSSFCNITFRLPILRGITTKMSALFGFLAFIAFARNS